MAQRLIAREQTAGGPGTAKASSAALAVDELYRSLSRWIGADGCHALFTRARAQGQGEHPPLDMLQVQARSKPYVEGVAETIAEYGEAATADAIESMLVRMIELLGRLIGEDMATNLIERSLPEPALDRAVPEKRRVRA